MAGTDPRFNAASFRDAVHFAMNMGLPTATNERATFKWTTANTYATQDSTGNPYDWTETASTSTSHADVQIPVAIQYTNANPDGTFVGDMDASKLTLTVLDTDYATIHDGNGHLADTVTIKGKDYQIVHEGPPQGLFDVTVYELFAEATT